MKTAKYLKKAFWFSLVVHAAVLCLMILFMHNSPTAMKKTINMDLSMKKMAETPPPEEEPEEPPEPVKPQELPKNALAPKTPGMPKAAAAPPQGPQTQAEGSVAVDAPENSGKAPFIGGGGGVWGDGDGEGGILTDYVKEQFDYIRTIVMQHIRYPEEAQNRGIEGRVLLSFVILSDGTVKDIKVIVSSGYTLLDKNAIDTVKNSAPFPKPPGNAELRIPINYVLET
jgi:protein TonB